MFLEVEITPKRVFRPFEIVDRIKSATPTSPIAVFRHDKGLDCFFANTIVALERIHCADYVGTYHNQMDIDGIEQHLREEEEKILQVQSM